MVECKPVSYTHLDVYKRQVYYPKYVLLASSDSLCNNTDLTGFVNFVHDIGYRINDIGSPVHMRVAADR